MNPQISLPPLERQDEIVALIEALHRTGQRLEELTAGEVDSVSDRQGRTFVLQHAQEQLRHSEAARQSAILNALPAHIALLDIGGCILTVNEAWRKFAGTNALQDPLYGVGLDYLAICESATGEHAAETHQIAAGIRSVLSGETSSYSTEYPCHSPSEQRWFLMTATPLAGSPPNGAVIMHADVTAERLAEETLRTSEERFRQMAENIQDVFFLRDVEANHMLYVSPAYEKVWGHSCASLYANPRSWIDSIHPDDLASTIENNQRRILDGEYQFEYRILRPDGSIRWIESRGFPIRDVAGKVIRIAGVAKNITERKQAESRIAYLNRVNVMRSSINALIVRVTDRDELFREACRVAVETGGFCMSLICMIDRSLTQIHPIAWGGKDEALMNRIRERYASAKEAPLTIVAQAVKQKRNFVSNDSKNDPEVKFNQELAEAGVRSIAVFPLIVGDEAVGTLVLYASEVEFFHEEEMRLLTELVGDIAFAIDHLNKAEKLNYLAYYDSLTGLANRFLFLERLQEKLQSAQRDHRKKAIIVLDIERFKTINDAFGRQTGDELLRQVAQRIVQSGGGDISRFARIGADQFAIAASRLDSVEQVGRLVEDRLEESFRKPFHIGDKVLRIAVKVGIALFPDDGIDAETLLRNAESALKKAKKTGDHYLFFTQAMTERIAERLSLENRLREAFDQEQFVLHYQPKINLASGQLVGTEALIRWNDPRTGLVPPGMFIPILEETGLINEVGRWALRQAIKDYLRWRNAGLTVVRIAVNVSPLQLRHPGFVAEIEQALSIDEHAAAGLELEITESLIMEDVNYSIESLAAIRAMGVTIAIDDFGTGFSSLSYLAKLPVDTLKVDRSFVIEMPVSASGLALVSTIIGLAHALKLKVVAEGVETEEQARLLRLLNCDEMQGYLFSKAVPADIFETRFLIPVLNDR